MYTGIMLYPGFSEYELPVLLSILKQCGKGTLFIGLDKQEVKGEAGLRCAPDVRIDEVDVSALDSIVLPEVEDFTHLVDHPELIDFLQKIHKKKIWIGSISSAPYLLSMSGLLDGRTYTTGLTDEQRQFLGTFSKGDFIDEPVVVDDNLITARGSHFIEFGIEYGKSLGLDFDERWYKH